jgi:hypothetical protein
LLHGATNVAVLGDIPPRVPQLDAPSPIPADKCPLDFTINLGIVLSAFTDRFIVTSHKLACLNHIR